MKKIGEIKVDRIKGNSVEVEMCKKGNNGIHVVEWCMDDDDIIRLGYTRLDRWLGKRSHKKMIVFTMRNKEDGTFLIDSEFCDKWRYFGEREWRE